MPLGGIIIMFWLFCGVYGVMALLDGEVIAGLICATVFLAPLGFIASLYFRKVKD